MATQDPNRRTATARAEPSLGERRVMMAVEQALKASHKQAAGVPIAGPDEHGAFPSAWRPGPFDQGVPPVVVDANVLRNDVRYACEKDRRTVLVTAANSGAIRLFAASHVIGELAEYAALWALESDGVTPAELEARWHSEYLPLIRVVQDRDLPRTLLDPAEVERVRVLEVVDPDDIPSVTLALAIKAFYLSEDGRALRAVYGESVDRADHHAWLERLMAGGDAGQLGKLIFSAGALPMAAGTGLFAGTRWIADRFSPWALAALGVGFAGALWAKPPSTATKQRIGDALTQFGVAVLYAYSKYQDAYADFSRMTPGVSSWKDLATSNHVDAMLTRFAMHTLARAPGGQMSVHELAAALPQIEVDQGDAVIAAALRRCGRFSQPYAGRWQLGGPALRLG